MSYHLADLQSLSCGVEGRYFSRRYVLPILKDLNMIKAAGCEYEKSNIAEIDEIFDYLAEKSKSHKQSIEELSKPITEENGIKEATVKFHNHNIYDKLGVTNKKQLLRFAAMYLQEKGENNI